MCAQGVFLRYERTYHNNSGQKEKLDNGDVSAYTESVR